MIIEKNLFTSSFFTNQTYQKSSLPNKKELICWQEYLLRHQRLIFKSKSNYNYLLDHKSHSLEGLYQQIISLNPMELKPQSIHFWRWPQPTCTGPAIYFVIDYPCHLDSPLLLYIGESSQMEKRWKSNHSCKNYLALYSEAMSQARLEKRLSIRFWTDVPEKIEKRRFIEEILIDHWRPAFNKIIRQNLVRSFLV
uniref:GIY-YIG domain-containing protein n=1 Tax=Paulinella chromatophora TaxID=39717 RepID=B1X5A9_PAUCH|nr:hypothetical protein PCC_0712 [Paulinella chromatophora]ACB43128.1 hypothetical protein PCC_0712 [Paulinella chromatophora]